MMVFISHFNFICAFSGLLLSAAFFLRRRGQFSNLILSFIFLMLSYHRLISFSVIQFTPVLKMILMYTSIVLVRAILFLPPAIYFYVMSIIKDWNKLTWKQMPHLIPFFVFFIIRNSQEKIIPETYLFNDPVNPVFQAVFTDHMTFAYLTTIIALGLMYSTYSLYLFRRSMKKHGAHRKTGRIKEYWIYSFLSLLVGNYIFRNMGMWTHFLGLTDQNFYLHCRALGDLCFDLIIAVSVYLSFFIPLDFNKSQPVEERVGACLKDMVGKKVKYEKLNLNSMDIHQIQESLLKFMEEEKPYLENTLTIQAVAQKMKVSMHHLSLVINSEFNQNFHHFINSYRVREVQKILRENQRKGIENNLINIALDAGFNSKSSFNVIFKKMAGMTPSEFKKSIKKGSIL
jgi:AraC-like DNA-binding protein